MNQDIEAIVELLQKKNKIPKGSFRISSKIFPASFVYRIEIDEFIFYIKKIKPRFSTVVDNSVLITQLSSEFDALTKFHRLFKDYTNFNVPKPIYLYKEELIIATEEVKGESVIELFCKFGHRFKQKTSRPLQVSKQIGEFLSILHNFETYPFLEKDLDDTLAYINKRLWDGAFNQRQEEKISTYLESLYESIKSDIKRQYTKCLIHSDFTPMNILYDKNRINVLDFANHRIDHPYNDLIYFKLMIEGQFFNRIKYKKYRVNELLKAFSNGYGIDFHLISKEKIYQLVLIKILSIFLKTYSIRKNIPIIYEMNFRTAIEIKNKIVNLLDLYLIKRKILKIAAQSICSD